MKKSILLYFVFQLALVVCFGQIVPDKQPVHIIPEPVNLKEGQGVFQLNQSTTILSTDDALDDISHMMADLLNVPTGYRLQVKTGSKENQDNAIILKLNKRPDAELGQEGYRLVVSSNKIVVSANVQNGLFYGMQTVIQLLPSEIQNKTAISSAKWTMPCVDIMDYPRFKWRGLMLDVSRHFFSKEFVMKYIDNMAKYKFNVFHWHLTDLTGWRIQIDGLPKLTEVGAWRVPRTGKFGTFDPANVGEKATDGGFYTKEDIKEVLAYAKKRFVRVVPEIDVPGHSRALIAAYPNLSCTQEEYAVDPGTRYFRKDDNALCVARDSTWLFMDKIFSEVAEMFPDEYIHIGGDEVHMKSWEKHEMDQALMKKEGISSLEGLQTYFEKRLGEMIIAKGKKTVGWYKLEKGELPTSESLFMCWQDIPSAIRAIKLGYRVVMAPNQDSYLDYDESGLTLQKVYNFEPVPEGVKEASIEGGEGCLWTERVPNERQAEYMTWPRAMGMAEVYWSPKNKRNWDDFALRVQSRLRDFDVAKVNYSMAAFEPVISAVGGEVQSELTKIKIMTYMPGLKVYYRFDETAPDDFAPEYEGMPLEIPTGATKIRVATYYEGKVVGRQELEFFQ